MNETVGLVGLAVVLAKTLEKLVDFVISKFKKVDKEVPPDSEMAEIKSDIEELKTKLVATYSVIAELRDIVNLKDINGTPMIYFPRNIEARQLEIINMVNDQAHSQENMIKILDRVADRLISMNGSQDQILHEVRK